MKAGALPVLLLAIPLLVSQPLAAQERKVPKDSSRVSVTGCISGRSLIVMNRPDGEPSSGAVSAGRRFRLSGAKKMVAELRAEEARMVEVTGLVRTSQLSPASDGVPIGMGGRIRIGGGPPNRDPTQIDPKRDPLVNEAVLDVEAWRRLPEACPARK